MSTAKLNSRRIFVNLQTAKFYSETQKYCGNMKVVIISIYTGISDKYYNIFWKYYQEAVVLRVAQVCPENTNKSPLFRRRLTMMWYLFLFLVSEDIIHEKT